MKPSPLSRLMPAVPTAEGRKRLLVLQHIPCEGPGRLEEFAKRRGVQLEVVHLIDGQELPRHFDYAAVVALGGSMNVYEESIYPWLVAENDYIREALNREVPYLGLCLGGQLLAKAVGGRVTRNARKEIGNFEVELTAAGREDPLFKGFPEVLPVFQWHGDTFSELGGGVNLARSAACEHQAFRWGARAYGLQFHVEVTCPMAEEWLHEYNEEMLAEGLKREPIVAEFRAREATYAALAERLFENFFALAGIGSCDDEVTLHGAI